jgi:AcrR family transcriptional regulator
MAQARKRVTRKRVPETRGRSNGHTRERILDATAQILSVKGFSGTRLSDVAEVAGLQAPAIYYHFPSREDLIEEVVRLGMVTAREHVTAALDELPASVGPMERITVAVEAHLRSVIELSDYTTAAIRNAGQLPSDMRSRLIKEQTEYGKVWHSLFEDAAKAGEIPSDMDLFAARMLVIGALNWVPEWWNPERDSIDGVVAAARRMTLGILAPS